MFACFINTFLTTTPGIKDFISPLADSLQLLIAERIRQVQHRHPRIEADASLIGKARRINVEDDSVGVQQVLLTH